MKSPPFILCALMVVSILHTVAAVSRPYVALVLATVKVVMFGAFTAGNTRLGEAALTAAQAALIRDVPIDVRTAVSKLHLEPNIIKYACC
ncbi:hypothetical protein BV20DRAFT_944213, partial [Pilatotrama ljubarskyi]